MSYRRIPAKFQQARLNRLTPKRIHKRMKACERAMELCILLGRANEAERCHRIHDRLVDASLYVFK